MMHLVQDAQTGLCGLLLEHASLLIMLEVAAQYAAAACDAGVNGFHCRMSNDPFRSLSSSFTSGFTFEKIRMQHS